MLKSRIATTPGYAAGALATAVFALPSYLCAPRSCKQFAGFAGGDSLFRETQESAPAALVIVNKSGPIVLVNFREE